MVAISVKKPKEIMQIGLGVMGWAPGQIRKCKLKTNLRRFCVHYGCNPKVLAQLFEDLQTTELLAARIAPSKIDIVVCQ